MFIMSSQDVASLLQRTESCSALEKLLSIMLSIPQPLVASLRIAHVVESHYKLFLGHSILGVPY